MTAEVRKLSKELGVGEEELVKKVARAYLEMELGRVRVEIYDIFSKYSVSSLSELDEKTSKDEPSETDALDDFTRLDYLEATKEKVESSLGVKCD